MGGSDHCYFSVCTSDRRCPHGKHSPAPLTVGGSVIERVVTYKLLGVYISDDLSWNVHIEHIVKKANKRLYALHALKKVASLSRS